MTIKENIEFNPELRMQDQSQEFQDWLMENCLSKIAGVTPDMWDELGSNATDFSVTINSVNYTKADITNVVVPVNTEITINDVTIAVGKDTGNVVLILK